MHLEALIGTRLAQAGQIFVLSRDAPKPAAPSMTAMISRNPPSVAPLDPGAIVAVSKKPMAAQSALRMYKTFAIVSFKGLVCRLQRDLEATVAMHWLGVDPADGGIKQLFASARRYPCPPARCVATASRVMPSRAEFSGGWAGSRVRASHSVALMA